MPAGPPRKWDVNIIIAQLERFIERVKAGEAKPRVIDFLCEIGLDDGLYYKMGQQHEELFSTNKKLIKLEEQYLLDLGETARNPAFAIFRLKQKGFNYTDKQEIQHEMKPTDTEQLTDEQKRAEIDRLIKLRELEAKKD